ncbi:Flagellar hook-basal body complex protein FliE 1 [Candidatus Terasakiella magnetica]|uniref:Flagellar hook-basal body complex protein FliE n=1 Tax=Candidatus Terasakiella magnetica TaxID=1867952 RepID=A0A1C3RKW8_9PROT|nr:flagellar hook-basal body complex protein FliE [Candidatus Terasakiella magnetica]SCA57903.1 Flagellar hook-basal body complex protein FliE 1 [Candidatus Terasakiella magnetica]
MADNMMASAAAAYAKQAQEMNNLPTLDSTKQAEEGGFADLLKEAVQEAASIGYKSEAMSLKAAAGQADVNDVVTAVAEAEVTLQAVTTVRDKVIQAYQDIIKMPI